VSPRQPSSICSVKYVCICALFANVQGSGTVAVLKNVTGKELAVFNNSSRFRSSIAVARIVRAGPVCAGASVIAGEAALVTADADMIGGIGGGVVVAGQKRRTGWARLLLLLMLMLTGRE
jgi:hypothetical protein